MSSIKLGLDRIKDLLSVLGNPEKKLPPTIHVAGTNGKGSTVAFMKSIAEQMGLSVHVMTSPHLTRFNERIVLAGQEIQDDYLYSILEECRIAAEKNNIQVSFFEGITAAAFLAFSRVKADLLLMETGLGGRLDGTNVLEAPALNVITPISYDHVNVLGNTLTAIAKEKCGILRKNVPCVVSMQTEEAYSAISAYADNLGVPLVSFEYDFGVVKDGDKLKYSSKDLDITIDAPSLPGNHQFINAATAITALKIIYGKNLSKEIIEKGITNAVWQGRLQKITRGALYNKLPKNWELVLDCAHNDSGAQALGVWLEEQPKLDNYLIFSMTRNRDVKKFLSYLPGKHIKKIYCTDIHSEPSAYRGADLLPMLREKYECHAVTSVDEAISEIAKCDNADKKRVVITGSIFLVSDFLISNKN